MRISGFIATYPASILREEDGTGFYVQFTDLSEALTGGDDFEESLVQAVDFLAAAPAGYIRRNDAIPVPSLVKRAQRFNCVPL